MLGRRAKLHTWVCQHHFAALLELKKLVAQLQIKKGEIQTPHGAGSWVIFRLTEQRVGIDPMGRGLTAHAREHPAGSISPSKQR